MMFPLYMAAARFTFTVFSDVNLLQPSKQKNLEEVITANAPFHSSVVTILSTFTALRDDAKVALACLLYSSALCRLTGMPHSSLRKR